MSLRETAEQVIAKLLEMNEKRMELGRLCELILLREEHEGETFELSNERKQKLIQLYLVKKAELQTLVKELP